MKKLSILTILSFFFIQLAFAQTVPQGMRYQAVARDFSGKVMANKDVTLKISLISNIENKQVIYSETHTAITNQFGLFGLVIGEGLAERGAFEEIPWSTNDVWMEVSIQEKGDTKFTSISNSRLLTVPYAFHAITAEQLVEKANADGTRNLSSPRARGNTGNTWKVGGNIFNVPGPHTFGTIEAVDLVMITHNEPRLTITAEGEVQIAGDLDVDGKGTFGDLVVENDATLNTNGTGKTTIEGETTINDNLITNGTSALNGQTTIKANLGGLQTDYSSYVLQVEGSAHGAAIKVNGVEPNRNTNWLTLFDGNGNPMGRIEGFRALSGFTRSIVVALIDVPGSATSANNNFSGNTGQSTDAFSTPTTEQYFNNDFAVGAISETLDFVNGIIKFGLNVAACFIGVGVAGDCDDAIWSAVDMIVQGIQLGGYLIYNEINKGAAFESGGADYAEWLRKANPKENLKYGDVVGIKGGLISKSFTDAENFMVVSLNPTIIGAMPDEGKAHLYEKIAFMGQVPVRVIGKVQKGDYILPSGNGDGLAVAVSPAHMRALDYGRIIGVAWGDTDGTKALETVNVAVGLNTNDMAKVVDQMQSLMNHMQKTLTKLDPTYKAHYFNVEGSIKPNQQAYTTAPTLNEVIKQQVNITQYNSKEEVYAILKQQALNSGFDMSEYPYIAELMNNPGDQELARKTIEHYTKASKKIQKELVKVQELRQKYNKGIDPTSPESEIEK